MKKQTAVEWLIEEIQKPNQDVWYWDNIFNQAKALEKHQQRLIYEGMLQNVGTSVKQSDLPTFEEYYKGTYGKA